MGGLGGGRQENSTNSALQPTPAEEISFRLPRLVLSLRIVETAFGFFTPASDIGFRIPFRTDGSFIDVPIFSGELYFVQPSLPYSFNFLRTWIR